MNFLIRAVSDAVKTYTIPLLAIAGMVMAAVTVINSSRPKQPVAPVARPPSNPFESSVAGSGIVETSTENIEVGTPVSGVVASVAVSPGQMVRAGDELFRIDDREIRATLAVREAAVMGREAALKVAQAQLESLRAYPRPESIPPAEAKVAEIEVQLEDAQNQLRKWEGVADPRAVPEDTVTQKRFAVAAFRARLAAARADLALLKAGTFAPEIAAAEAAVREAQAQIDAARAEVDSVKVEIDRRIVRAAVNGKILQVNVRPGEFAQAGATADPLVLMGGVEPLHVRVDIDETEAWRVRENCNAQAFLRGNSTYKADLRFVRFEPYIVPKRSLTGESTERVDTRVLQIVFAVDKADFPLFVGQQVDVYVQAPGRDPSSATDSSTPTTGNRG